MLILRGQPFHILLSGNKNVFVKLWVGKWNISQVSDLTKWTLLPICGNLAPPDNCSNISHAETDKSFATVHIYYSAKKHVKDYSKKIHMQEYMQSKYFYVFGRNNLLSFILPLSPKDHSISLRILKYIFWYVCLLFALCLDPHLPLLFVGN